MDRLFESVASRQALLERTSSQTKIAQKTLYLDYRRLAPMPEQLPSVRETGFRVFSQFDEDGILLFLLGVIGIGPGTFVDIGGGDGITASNCANLAFNFGFHGLFVDANGGSVEHGRRLYKKHPDTQLFPPRFRHATVERENINSILDSEGFSGEIDVLSVDIDGNDYWIWEAIDRINPRIVVIETHVEFGMNSIVVPYKESSIHSQTPSHYLGASPVAMTKLADRLGYRLVGANRFGFNAFYLRHDLGAGILPDIAVEDLLQHERNKERMALFEDIKNLDYEII